MTRLRNQESSVDNVIKISSIDLKKQNTALGMLNGINFFYRNKALLLAKKDKYESCARFNGNAPETAKEINRMLGKPGTSRNLESQSASNTSSSSDPNATPNDQVFKTPSPTKPLNPEPGSSNATKTSPLKSRKSQLKSKVPTKKPQCMPILDFLKDSGGNEKPIMDMVKKTLDQNDDNITKEILAEPIANSLSGNFFTTYPNKILSLELRFIF